MSTKVKTWILDVFLIFLCLAFFDMVIISLTSLERFDVSIISILLTLLFRPTLSIEKWYNAKGEYDAVVFNWKVFHVKKEVTFL